MKRRRNLNLRILMSKIIPIDSGKKFGDFFERSIAPRKIDFLVLHHVAAKSAEDAIAEFVKHQVSAHFLIDEQGKIFELVAENDVAYHAGVSFWKGVDGLNKFSIGIEFVNENPEQKNFTPEQMIAGAELSKYLIQKHNIVATNVVGHSDIAYDRVSGFLNRKQDPSHLFDWKFMAQNGVGIFPRFNSTAQDKLFELGDVKKELGETKRQLQKFGYRVTNLNDVFDEEMRFLAVVFNRRFLNSECEYWSEASQDCLRKIIDVF